MKILFFSRFFFFNNYNQNSEIKGKLFGFFKWLFDFLIKSYNCCIFMNLIVGILGSRVSKKK